MEELRTETVLDLKRRAKESKLAEDKEKALEWLKQAKELQETQNLSLQLKKLAIYFKQQGKLDEASTYYQNAFQLYPNLSYYKNKS